MLASLIYENAGACGTRKDRYSRSLLRQSSATPPQDAALLGVPNGGPKSKPTTPTFCDGECLCIPLVLTCRCWGPLSVAEERSCGRGLSARTV